MQTRTYGDLFKLASALIGTGGQLSDGEQDQLSHFINRRFSEIFNASPSWPRYVVVGEPRTIVANQTVPYAEDSFYVYGAGESDVNGLYAADNLATTYSRNVSPSATYTIFPGQSGLAFIVDQDDNIIYQAYAANGKIPQSGWSTFAVPPLTSTPTEIVAIDVANISEFIRIHRTKPFVNRSALEYEFYVSALGAHILNQVSTTEGTAWVTYKQEFTPFTVTSDYYNSTVEVPGEFFNFISHAVYADFLRVQNKQEEALAEEQAAQTFLALELEKIDIRSNNNTINHKFSTYVNRQAR